jgi:hypothetical protein
MEEGGAERRVMGRECENVRMRTPAKSGKAATSKVKW